MKSLNKMPILTLDDHPKTMENLESGKYKYNSKYNLYAPLRTRDSIKHMTKFINTDSYSNEYNIEIEELLEDKYDPLFRFLCVCLKCKKIWYDNELKYRRKNIRGYFDIIGRGHMPIYQYTGLCPKCNSLIVKFTTRYEYHWLVNLN
ncbi:MAG: hypothetical protein JXA99_04065 [Candidatus Lokiarchaeota archaeon]|nr:hypothetical protein [Candidatus Lokiarchaeota archaeon]